MSSNDAQLVAQVRAKDAAALGEFIELRRPQLAAFIERELGAALRRKVEPEDVFQEACAEAVRALPAAELAERDPFSWLCQLAERKIIDLHRRHFGAQKRNAAREVSLDSPGSDTETPGLIHLLAVTLTTPSQAFSRGIREARLAAAVQGLPAEQGEALRLRYVENLPSKQIAQRLGKSDAAVRVMLTRALKKLQQTLENDAKLQ